MSETWEQWETCRPAGYAFENAHAAIRADAELVSSRLPGFKRKRSDYKLRPKRRKRRKTMHDERWNMRLPATLAAKLRRLAAAEGITGSQWVRQAIEKAKEPEAKDKA